MTQLSSTGMLTFVFPLDVGCVSSPPSSKSNSFLSGSSTDVSDVLSTCLTLHTKSIQSGTFIRESHSRLYSPEVFAISQLLSEIPNSVICAVVYWVLMVYPIGFGAGSVGLNGTGFQLLAIIFTEFFGVTLGQLVGALAPSIQVRSFSLLDSFVTRFIDLENHLGRSACCSIPRSRFRCS